MSLNFEAELYEALSKKGNSVPVQKNGTSYKRNDTHVKKYRELISNNVCEPNDVNVESPESDKSESVLEVSLISRPVRIRKLQKRFDDFVMT